MTDDKETVERVAKAIAEERGFFGYPDGVFYFDSSEWNADDFRKMARAAIEAMPRPTIRVLNDPPPKP